jgi:hypothetical protein
MAKYEGGFFWGVLLGAVTAAIAGCLALSRSFRTTPAVSGAAKRATPGPRKPKSGAARQVRKAKKTKAG